MPNRDARRIARDDGAKVIPLRAIGSSAGQADATRLDPVDEPVVVVIEGDPALTPTITRALVESPVRVVLTSPSGATGRATVALLGDLSDRVAVRRLTLTDPDSVERLTTWLRVRLGRCDVLVDAAATTGAELMILEENLAGTRQLIHAVEPLMRRQYYGRIAFVLSGPGVTAADAAMDRVHEFTRSMADDLYGTGIVIDTYPPQPAVGDVDLLRWLADLLRDPPRGGL
ncbi:SDR family NAD(P)-dependent oxidoreductase [Micromonospora sp. NPDC126480]|uniref:SDR family NAD(P)-dependent oxidoreductase n=1 Tax=Micromonospora sp. NPDC126480 TaxID=3155312 RepID=UPI0033281ACA